MATSQKTSSFRFSPKLLSSIEDQLPEIIQKNYPEMTNKLKELYSLGFKTLIPIPYTYWNLMPEKYLIFFKDLNNSDLEEAFRPDNSELNFEEIQKSKNMLISFLEKHKPTLTIPTELDKSTWVSDSIAFDTEPDNRGSHKSLIYKRLKEGKDVGKLTTSFKFLNKVIDVGPANARCTYINDIDTKFSCKWYNTILQGILKQLPGNVIAANNFKFSQETEFMIDSKRDFVFFETDLKKNGLTLPHQCIIAACEALDEFFKPTDFKFVDFAFAFKNKKVFVGNDFKLVPIKRGTGLGNSNELETLVHLMIGIRSGLSFTCLNDDICFLLGKKINLGDPDEYIRKTEFIMDLYKSHNFILNPSKTLVGGRCRFCENYFNTEQICSEFSKSILYILPILDSIMQGNIVKSKEFLNSLNLSFGHLGLSRVYLNCLPIIIERIGTEFGDALEFLLPPEFGGFIQDKPSELNAILPNVEMTKSEDVNKFIVCITDDEYQVFNQNPVIRMFRKDLNLLGSSKDLMAIVDNKAIARFSKYFFSMIEKDSVESALESRSHLFSKASFHNKPKNYIFSVYKNIQKKRFSIFNDIKERMTLFSDSPTIINTMIRIVKLMQSSSELEMASQLIKFDQLTEVRSVRSKRSVRVGFYRPPMEFVKEVFADMYKYIQEYIGPVETNISLPETTKYLYRFEIPSKHVVYNGQNYRLEYPLDHSDAMVWQTLALNYKAVANSFFCRYNYLPKNLVLQAETIVKQHSDFIFLLKNKTAIDLTTFEEGSSEKMDKTKCDFVFFENEDLLIKINKSVKIFLDEKLFLIVNKYADRNQMIAIEFFAVNLLMDLSAHKFDEVVFQYKIIQFVVSLNLHIRRKRQIFEENPF